MLAACTAVVTSAVALAESSAAERMVPLVCEPDDVLVAVTGDPLRPTACVSAHYGTLGNPVAKRVELPNGWEEKLRVARSRRAV